MKRIAAIWICLILLFSSTSVYLSAVTSSLGLDDTPLSPGPGPQPGMQLYYTDRTTFNLDTGPLQFFEDFEEGDENAMGDFGGTLDQYTDNGYFKPGDIEPGIRLQDNPGPDTNGLGLVYMPPFISKTVATNIFTDSMDMYFFNNDVWAVGMELQSYFGACTPTIKIYTTGDVLLDTVTAPADNTGIFWGVISDELITHINIYDASNSEGGDNIAFGQTTLTVDHIELTPDPVTVVVGENQQFTATAYDIFNNTIPGVMFFWTTNVGVVNSTGFFTAQTAPGTGIVTATSGTTIASASVTVVPGVIDHIIVTPDPATVIVGGTQQFTATAYDVFDNIIPGVGFVWTTDVGSVDATGLFTAQVTPATGSVTATNGTVSGSATVDVIVPDIHYIIVTPDPITVSVRGTQQFTATEYDSYNNVVPVANFVWTTDVGVINSTGFFTAQSTPAGGTVTARNGPASGTANVDVIDFVINLSLGWNLISIPLEQSDESIDQVLSSIDGKWDCIQAYDAVNDKWLSNITSRPDSLNDLKTLDHKMGFWINITESNVNLTVGGLIPASTSIPLYAGWNLVGYPTLNDTMTVANALWGTGADKVEVFDPGEPYRLREVGPTYVMTPGEGYWVHVTADAVWVVEGNNNITLGPVHHIVVEPNPVSVMVGGTQAFTATAYDASNNIIPGAVFIWSTDVGSIDATGLFTAQTVSGVGVVTATNGTISGSATVNVVVGPVDHILMLPDPVPEVPCGGTIQFIATAYDAYNNVIPGAIFNWSTNVGTITQTGFFTAQATPGTGYVNVTCGPSTASISVTVGSGPIGLIDHIIVIPDTLMIMVGEVQQFTAIAYDQFNNVIPGVDFFWTTDVGAVNSTGLFTAQTAPKIGIVSATNGTVTGTANVTVVVGPVDNIIVLPDPVTVKVDQTQQFNATAYDLYNNVIPGVGFVWMTDVGTIDATGFFTAQTTPGVGIVTATNSTITGFATVVVEAGAIHHIIVTPNPAVIMAGNTQQFTAMAYDEYNNTILGVDFNWTSNIWNETGWYILPPGEPGWVNATNGTVTGSANVTVIYGDIDYIIVTPDPAFVIVGMTQQFTAVAYNMFNANIPGIGFSWSSNVGVINSTGFFTAQSTPATGTVTATNGTYSGSANVTIVGAFNIDLSIGWNLISLPLIQVDEAIDKVMVFDPAEPYGIKEVGPNYVMKPGEGYWVHVPADTTWIIDW